MIVESKDFSNVLETDHRFRFGLTNRENLIRGLLKIVRAVADGRMLVQSVELGATVTHEDYAMERFGLTYAEQRGTGDKLIVDAAILRDLLAEAGLVR